MILPTHQFFNWWSRGPKNWNNLSKFPQQNGDGNPSHSSVIALFLPSVQAVVDAGLGSGGQGDKLNSGWHRCLCASRWQGRSAESLPDNTRKRRRSRGRKERVQNSLFDQILFLKCYIQDSRSAVTFALLPWAGPRPSLHICYLDCWDWSDFYSFP